MVISQRRLHSSTLDLDDSNDRAHAPAITERYYERIIRIICWYKMNSIQIQFRLQAIASITLCTWVEGYRRVPEATSSRCRERECEKEGALNLMLWSLCFRIARVACW
jgi:hypothetical protein